MRHRPLDPGQPVTSTDAMTAWPPVTLRERGFSAGGPGKKRTKPPGTSGSLAFPCERADHLEVSCSERYRQSCWSSSDCGKANFGQVWTTVWKRCAPLRAGLWTTLTRCRNLRVSCVETCWTGGLIYFVWLFMSQSQGLIQILRRGRLSPTVQSLELEMLATI